MMKIIEAESDNKISESSSTDWTSEFLHSRVGCALVRFDLITGPKMLRAEADLIDCLPTFLPTFSEIAKFGRQQADSCERTVQNTLKQHKQETLPHDCPLDLIK